MFAAPPSIYVIEQVGFGYNKDGMHGPGHGNTSVTRV